MRNERLHDGDKISLPVPAGTLSGAPVLAAGFIGVTATKVGEGGNIATRASVWRTGEFTLPITDAVSTEGTPIYITAANVLTTTAGSDRLFGRTHADAEGNGATKSSGAGSVNIILAKV